MPASPVGYTVGLPARPPAIVVDEHVVDLGDPIVRTKYVNKTHFHQTGSGGSQSPIRLRARCSLGTVLARVLHAPARGRLCFARLTLDGS